MKKNVGSLIWEFREVHFTTAKKLQCNLIEIRGRPGTRVNSKHLNSNLRNRHPNSGVVTDAQYVFVK